MDYRLGHLEQLEAESIHLFRKSIEQFNKPFLLFSGGKNSIVMIHLALRAFYPDKIPFDIVHIDTGHNFKETLQFRDKLADDLGLNLVVGEVEESIKKGTAIDETGPLKTRNVIQSITLSEVIKEYQYDALFGGARRDEEKARAKERIFSHRDSSGNWKPTLQRPELWNLYNGMKKEAEHFRIFPLNNWTELDIWEYIRLREIQLPDFISPMKGRFSKGPVSSIPTKTVWNCSPEKNHIKPPFASGPLEISPVPGP